MVAPLARLSAQVDKVAGGDLTIAVPRSRIGEIANIAQAVEGMTAALGETRATTSRSGRGETVPRHQRRPRPAHAALRAARTPAGDRLPAGRPGASTSSEPKREPTRSSDWSATSSPTRATTTRNRRRSSKPSPVADLLQEVTAGLEHTTRLRDNTFDLDGDQALEVIVDRDRFKRALTNILDNALRYSPAGAPIHLSWAAD